MKNMQYAKWMRILSILLLCALLTGCSAVTEAPGSATLPPIAAVYEAPVGDAGLQEERIVPLYLPSKDGQTLVCTYVTLLFSRDRHPAETILRALLAYEGDQQVRPLGGDVMLMLTGASPVEVCGRVCTVNLSAGALQLSSQQLHTVVLAMAATLCELDDITHVNLMVAGSPIAMDVGGNLPLGAVTSAVGQELPVLWEQLSARRTPVGELASATPLTATAALYFPLADGTGVVAEPRRIAFPGQHPQQLVMTLLEALSHGADVLSGTADMPDYTLLQLFLPEVTELQGGGRRVTLHLTSDALNRISAAGCDPTCYFAAVTSTLTSFVPSLQQVCILLGDNALTSLYSDQLGSMLFPDALETRADFAAARAYQTVVYLPQGDALCRRELAMPYRSACDARAMLLMLADASIGAIPQGLKDADILGLAVTDGTLLVHFSARYGDIIRESGMDQRLMAYSIVNTLCLQMDVRRVRFYFGGETVDSLGDDLVWSGEFLFSPHLVTQ